MIYSEAILHLPRESTEVLDFFRADCRGLVTLADRQEIGIPLIFIADISFEMERWLRIRSRSHGDMTVAKGFGEEASAGFRQRLLARPKGIKESLLFCAGQLVPHRDVRRMEETFH